MPFQATPAAGGWNLGGGPFHEFAWPEQVDLQNLANSGNARISFTLSVDDSTSTPGVAQCLKLMSKKGCERIVRLAFEVAAPRRYISPGYQDNLGWAYGTALGVQAALPDRAVVAICGDGGFMCGGWLLSRQ